MNFLTQDIRPVSLIAPAPKIGTVRWTALVLFRLSQLAGRRSRFLATMLKQLNHMLTGADLAWESTAGSGLALLHPTGVVIGKEVHLGECVVLQDSVTLGGSGGDDDGHPRVGDRVLIGCGAKILGPVSIGADAKIGANAVVLSDVPAGATAVGVPARVLLRRDAEK